jgi:hypothetical protein
MKNVGINTVEDVFSDGELLKKLLQELSDSFFKNLEKYLKEKEIYQEIGNLLAEELVYERLFPDKIFD